MKRFAFVLLAAAVVLMASSAFASSCPALGNANDCNLIITIGNGGSVSTSVTGAVAYDGVEDQYVGVFNTATDGFVLSSLGLTGFNIFGFDGDGAFGASCINTVISIQGPCGTGGSATYQYYNGPNTTFTIFNASSGVVHFTGGLSGGQAAYFSLEEPASLNGLTGITPNVPEPSSMILFGTGLAGLAGTLRRKLRK